ncbi:pectin lyase fold/virulence factor [Gorgonomyces haynaldii]|nr:pectin lyase fold/virulence factor [Gorgonomyces haynaldii]
MFPSVLAFQVSLLSTNTAKDNAALFVNAVYQANQSVKDRTITVPSGTFSVSGPIQISSLFNVTLELKGKLIFQDNIDSYPFSNGYPDLLSFTDCHQVAVVGYQDSLIDGSGYEWWKQSLLQAVKKSKLKSDNRPKLLTFHRSSSLSIYNLTLANAPFWNLNLQDVKDVIVDRLVVDTDLTKQDQVQSSFGNYIQGKIPLFPLNTDGIDPSGINITITNFKYTGYDDAVAVKPCNKGCKFSDCTRNILVENATVNFGVGMTIGSVPGTLANNCVSDVVMRNVEMHYPFKAIYVKSNPGNGPQQQEQPDGGSAGCSFLYPAGKCPTNPFLTMSGITLRNIEMKDTIWPFAGAVLFNASNPGRDLVFENVGVTGSTTKVLGFKCENAFGRSTKVSPKVCF